MLRSSNPKEVKSHKYMQWGKLVRSLMIPKKEPLGMAPARAKSVTVVGELVTVLLFVDFMMPFATNVRNLDILQKFVEVRN